MRSLSTNAFGQPNDTIPIVGWLFFKPLGIFGFARSGRLCVFIYTICTAKDLDG
jgi:hypothetical protein